MNFVCFWCRVSIHTLMICLFSGENYAIDSIIYLTQFLAAHFRQNDKIKNIIPFMCPIFIMGTENQ